MERPTHAWTMRDQYRDLYRSRRDCRLWRPQQGFQRPQNFPCTKVIKFSLPSDRIYQLECLVSELGEVSLHLEEKEVERLARMQEAGGSMARYMIKYGGSGLMCDEKVRIYEGCKGPLNTTNTPDKEYKPYCITTL